MWKVEDLVENELINVDGITVNSEHDIFLVDDLSRFQLLKIGDSRLESIRVELSSRIRSNICVSGHDLFFICSDEDIVMLDAKESFHTTIATCNSDQSYVTLDELNRLYTFEDGHIFRLDDNQYFAIEKALKVGFVVHENILYAPLSKNIIKYHLESESCEELHIVFEQGQQFRNLSFLTVDHKQHKLYAIDSKQKSIYQVTLSEPHHATLIYKAEQPRKRDGPSCIAVMDGIVYLLDCVFFGTENFYMLRKLTERIGWKIQRLLWIASIKCDPIECKMARLPRDVIKFIIQVIQN